MIFRLSLLFLSLLDRPKPAPLLFFTLSVSSGWERVDHLSSLILPLPEALGGPDTSITFSFFLISVVYMETLLIPASKHLWAITRPIFKAAGTSFGLYRCFVISNSSVDALTKRWPSWSSTWALTCRFEITKFNLKWEFNRMVKQHVFWCSTWGNDTNLNYENVLVVLLYTCRLGPERICAYLCTGDNL